MIAYELVRENLRREWQATLKALRDVWRVVVGEPDPPLPQFEEEPMCPKCTYTEYSDKQGPVAFRLTRFLDDQALERTCPRCGATWLMQCADAEEANA